MSDLPPETTHDLESGGPAGSQDPRSPAWRPVVVVICVVLAGLLTVPAAVAYWGQRTLNDTARYVDTVSPLVDSPEVQEVIATQVTTAIEQRVDVEAILDDVFSGVITDRPRLQRLTGVLAGSINAQIERVTREFIASPTFAEIWDRAHTRAQQGLQRALRGNDSGLVSLQGDEVVLDLDELIDQVSQRLVDRGIPVVSRVQAPETDRQIVLLEAPALRDLRTIYAFANPVATWLLPVVGLLYLAAFVAARRRPRMAVTIGVLIAANALLLALALSVGRQLFVNHLTGTAFGPASRVFYDTLLSYLLRGQQVLLAAGLILIIAGWFAGATSVGASVRGAVVSGLEGTGARIAESAGDGRVGAAGRWVAANIRWLRPVVVAVGVVVLLWGNNPTLPRLWWVLALTLILLACLQVLVGTGHHSVVRHRAPPPQAPPAAAP
ncbi:hypothetical protein MWU75_17350 [Ornithinimicrobium sp. F0845]|uniref:hypothetical protein n=1 Tax=Ornithinimicrobium sp. F0845 TaxID=2926412 RepID=UPI001FF5AB18|nr:hypothetical protein [Ornithinimicrobium sp. F0845]MCK0113914.1 hypothetical protein [Ornithinimicrobium sp. F0845]